MECFRILVGDNYYKVDYDSTNGKFSLPVASSHGKVQQRTLNAKDLDRLLLFPDNQTRFSRKFYYDYDSNQNNICPEHLLGRIERSITLNEKQINGYYTQSMLSELICTVGDKSIFLKRDKSNQWQKLDVNNGSWEQIPQKEFRSISDHIGKGSFNKVYAIEELRKDFKNADRIVATIVDQKNGFILNNDVLNLVDVNLTSLLAEIENDIDLNIQATLNTEIADNEVEESLKSLTSSDEIDRREIINTVNKLCESVNKYANDMNVTSFDVDNFKDQLMEIVDRPDSDDILADMKNLAHSVIKDIKNEYEQDNLGQDTDSISQDTYSVDTDSVSQDTDSVDRKIDNNNKNPKYNFPSTDYDNQVLSPDLPHVLKGGLVNQMPDITGHGNRIDNLEYDRNLQWRDTERLRNDMSNFGQDVNLLRDESLLHRSRIDDLGRESLESRIDIGNLHSDADRSYAMRQDHADKIGNLSVDAAMHGERLNTHAHDITRNYGTLDMHSQRIGDVMLNMHSTSQDVKLMDTVARIEKERMQDRMNTMQQEHARDIDRIQRELEKSKQLPYTPMQGAFAMQHGMGELVGKMQQLDLALAKMQQIEASNAALQQNLDRANQLANAVAVNRDAVEAVKRDSENFKSKRDSDINAELKSLSDRNNALNEEIANIKAMHNKLVEQPVIVDVENIATKLAESDRFQSSIAARVTPPLFQSPPMSNVAKSIDHVDQMPNVNTTQLAFNTPKELTDKSKLPPIRTVTPSVLQSDTRSIEPSVYKSQVDTPVSWQHLTDQEDLLEKKSNAANVIMQLKNDLLAKKAIFKSKENTNVGIGIDHDTSRYDAATNDDFSIRLRNDSKNRSRLDVMMHTPGCMIDPDILYGVLRGQVDVVNIADTNGTSIAHFAPGDNNYELYSAPLVIENFAPKSAPEHERKMIRIIVHEDGILEVDHRDAEYNDAELDNIKISGRSIKSILSSKGRVNIYNDVDEMSFSPEDEIDTAKHNVDYSQVNAKFDQTDAKQRTDRGRVNKDFAIDADASERDRHAIRDMELANRTNSRFKSPRPVFDDTRKSDVPSVSYAKKDDVLLLNVHDKELAMRDGALDLASIREKMDDVNVTSAAVLINDDSPSFSVDIENNEQGLDSVAINVIDNQITGRDVQEGDLDSNFINIGDHVVNLDGQILGVKQDSDLLEQSCLNIDHPCDLTVNGELIEGDVVEQILDDVNIEQNEPGISIKDRDIKDSSLDRSRLHQLERGLSRPNKLKRVDWLSTDLEDHAKSREKLNELELRYRLSNMHGHQSKKNASDMLDDVFVIAHNTKFDAADETVDKLSASNLLTVMDNSDVDFAKIIGPKLSFYVHISGKKSRNITVENVQLLDSNKETSLDVMVNDKVFKVDANGVRSFADLDTDDANLILDMPVKFIIDGKMIMQSFKDDQLNIFGDRPNDNVMQALNNTEWANYKDDVSKEHYQDSLLEKGEKESWHTEDRFLKGENSLLKKADIFVKDKNRKGKSTARTNKDNNAILVKSNGRKEDRALNLAPFVNGELSSMSNIIWKTEIKSENDKKILIGSNVNIKIQRSDGKLNFDISDFSSRTPQFVLFGNKVVELSSNSGARVVVDGFSNIHERRLWEQSCKIISPFPPNSFEKISLSFNGIKIASVDNKDRKRDADYMNRDNKKAVDNYRNKYCNNEKNIKGVGSEIGFSGGKKSDVGLFDSNDDGLVAVVKSEKVGLALDPKLFRMRKSTTVFNKDAKKTVDSMKNLRVCNEVSGKCFKLSFGVDKTNESSVLRVDENIGGSVCLRTEKNLIVINGNEVTTARLPIWMSGPEATKYSDFDIDLRMVQPKEGLKVEFANSGHYAYITGGGDVSINTKYDKSADKKQKVQNDTPEKDDARDDEKKVVDIYDGETKLSDDDLDRLKSQVSKIKDKALLEKTGSLLSGDIKYLEQDLDTDSKVSKVKKGIKSSKKSSSPLR